MKLIKVIISIMLIIFLALGIGYFILSITSFFPSSSAPAPSSSSLFSPPPSLPSRSSPAPDASLAPPAGEQVSPQQTVDATFTAVRDMDITALQALLLEPVDLFNSIPDDFQEDLQPYFRRISWDTGNAEVNGSSAKVDVSVTNPDIGKVVSALTLDVAKYTAIQALTGKKPDYETYLHNYIRTKVNWDTLPLSAKEVTVTLALDADGVWKVDNQDDGNKELLNTLSGGVLDTMQKFSSIIGG